mgnify:CR=1 FL=1
MRILHRTPDKRRGISTVIAGTIIILLIIVGVVPLLMLYLSTAQTMLSMYNIRATYEELKSLERVEANVSDDVLTVRNVGSVPVDITFITLKNSNDACAIVLNIYDYISTVPNALIDSSNVTLNSVQEVVRIDQGGYVKLNISALESEGVTDVCSIATAKGNVIEVTKVYTGIAEKARAIIVTPITLDVATLANRTDITVSETQIQPATPSNPGTGMSRISTDGSHKTALIRYSFIKSKSSESRIRIKGKGYWDHGYYYDSIWIPYSNIYVGYDPEWSKNKVGPPRYNIMITGQTPIDILIEGIDNSSVIAYFYNSSISYHESYDENSYLFHMHSWPHEITYRIKIIGYVPNDSLELTYRGETYSNNNALGYWWLYSGTETTKEYFKLDGNASEVIIYIDAYDMGYDIEEASYDPYIFSADVDGNGYPEFLFITEDMDFGDRNWYNDVTSDTWADDWSEEKFFMNLTGYVINGRDTAIVQIAIRVYFHDNLGDDTDEVEYTDRTIFGIYLVDASNNRVVSSREWNYQELDDLEDTFPPNKNFVMLTATLVVPRDGTYYLAIGFLDPYSDYRAWDKGWSNWKCSNLGMDDGDFIVALEIAGLTFYARP